MSRIIPFDIELEIIKTLPVKSLIRFISVCKAWKLSVDCSEFVAGYRVRPTQPHHLLIGYQVRDPQESEVKYVCFVDDDTFPQQKFAQTVPPLVQLLDGCTIISSSHGLLCLYGLFPEPDDSTTRMAVLWNPSIRKSIAVAVRDVFSWPFETVLGFGVCPRTNDPMLVKINYIFLLSQEIEIISCIPCQVEVFTLSSGEWRIPRSNLPRKSIGFTWIQAVIGQFIYWLAFDKTAEDGGFGYHNLIMSFDMGTEEFREVKLPDSLAYPYGSNLFISRLRESLVLQEYSRNPSGKRVCDLWMMRHGDSKAFTKLYTIEAPHASVMWTLEFRKCGEPIVIMHDDDDEYFNPPSVLAVYEPCFEYVKDLGICGNRHSFFGSSYTELLLLLDHDDGRIVSCGVVIEEVTFRTDTQGIYRD